MFKVKTQPENFYYSILLLKQPWRTTNELLNGCNIYQDSFMTKKDDLPEAVDYFEKITNRENLLEIMAETIENAEQQLQQEEKNSDGDIYEELGCVPDEIDNAMEDFLANKEKQSKEMFDWLTEGELMNKDQRRIFDSVFQSVKDSKKICRKFVTGEAGTGKCFVIKCITHAVREELKQDVAILAPTGIAAFNIGGMTMHRLLQSPVEYKEGTPKYFSLSDAALKSVREKLKNVVLVILDEISMVSNINFLYMHLRLVEIFNTFHKEGGWFGKMNLLVFGDLLQLPPVGGGPVFVPVQKNILTKCVQSLASVDLWSLLDYDELRINMRQKEDETYKKILGNLRVGSIAEEDTEKLKTRLINLNADNLRVKLNRLCNYVQSLDAAVCIMPTNELCDALNDAMLAKNTDEEIELFANDKVDVRVPAQRQYAYKKLQKNDDASMTAGLSKIIRIKKKVRVMIRRNINTSLGLVNVNLCVVDSVTKSVTSEVEKVNVRLPSGEIHAIKRVKVTFEISTVIYVEREQFPLILSYAITVHTET